MGFAPVASMAILLVAGLAALAGYQNHADAAADEVRKATREAEQLASDRRQTAVAILSTTYNNGQNRLVIDATNTGSTVIQSDGIDVIANGAWRSVSSVQVGGSEVAYWAPATTARITVLDVPSNPTRVVVVAHNGVSSYGGA